MVQVPQYAIRSLRSSASGLDLELVKVSYCGPALWNAVPDELHSIKTISVSRGAANVS